MVDFQHTRNVIAADPEIAYSEYRVWIQYGDRVSVAERGQALNKFGRTEEVTTTSRTVALLGSGEVNETYQTDNTIDRISSSGAGDMQDVWIEGHTVDANGNFTYVTQTVTLTGQTPATLSTPLARVHRAYNAGATNFAGAVYVFRDTTVSGGVPQTAANVHLVVPQGKNQSFKAAMTVAADEYYFITEVYAAVNKKVGADVDVELEIREKGGVFRQQFPLSVSTDGANSFNQPFRPYIIVPKNADVRLTASALTGTSIAVSGGFDGYLAKVVP